jgi:lipoprotein-releasing system permease protein
MYKLLLILKYLRRKLAPMFAALAVTLCTAMVIIVISVMGGFLETLRDAAQQSTGDIVIGTRAVNGFPHYETMIDRLEASEEIATATPIIQSLGLVRVSGGRGRDSSVGVQILGVKPRELNEVVGYRSSLYWTTEKYRDYAPPGLASRPAGQTRQPADTQPGDAGSFGLIESGMTFEPSPWLAKQAGGRADPGLVLGIEANPQSERDAEGRYMPATSAVGKQVVLTVVPVSQGGQVTGTELKRMQVVNEFKSGVHEIDSRRAYMDFASLQAMLQMDPAQKADPDATGQTPGRTHRIMAKAESGVSPEAARDAAMRIIRQMWADYPDLPPIGAMTWKERHQTIISAVENERNLMLFLFGIISLVAVVMVAQTFYMIVLEKTRDIGVLRALGASKRGIMGLYLGYGLGIGIVGALAGLAIAWTIVTNLNGIQDLIAQWTGWRMWSPKIYMFDEIPDDMRWSWAGGICVAAVLASIVGALIPAWLASRLDPVEAIRHE